MKLSLLVKQKEKKKETKREERKLLLQIGTGLLQIAIFLSSSSSSEDGWEQGAKEDI
jgi:hypothetical protein